VERLAWFYIKIMTFKTNILKGRGEALNGVKNVRMWGLPRLYAFY
jgi:hypothetical protein